VSLRVRFAPSPTGYLHVGGARTALFNWLLARKEEGVFILRVEDTDQARSRDEHTEAILHGLSWLGLDWDEGPYFQSDGVDRHRAAALQLLEEGKAYRDFSDPDEIRAEAERRQMHASRVARERADALPEGEAEERAEAGEAHAIRFRVPSGETRFADRVHGTMRFGNADIDDLVILRSDGTPIYNLAVVSDDHEMGINLVLRGDDHLSNTPKQVLLYRALGYPEPEFAHVPLILGADGKRLSKRHGATAVGDYEEQGILPEAMRNFLALLGWNPGDDREVFLEIDELVEAFSSERILKKSSVFDTEKLEWLNGRHLAEMPAGELLDRVRGRLRSVEDADEALLSDTAWITRLVDLLKVRSRTVDELADGALPFVCTELVFEEKAVAKHWEKDPAAAEQRMERLLEVLEDTEWALDPLEEAIRGVADDLDVGAGKVIHPLRLAVTGRQSSPGIFQVLVLLGRGRTVERLRSGLERVRAL